MCIALKALSGTLFLLKGLEMFSRAIITLGTPPIASVLDISMTDSQRNSLKAKLSWVWFPHSYHLIAMNLIAQLSWPSKHLALLTFTVSSVTYHSPNSCVETPWESVPILPQPLFSVCLYFKALSFSSFTPQTSTHPDFWFSEFLISP